MRYTRPMSPAEARRAARASWSAQVFRDGGLDSMTEADDEFWLRIPVDQRARVVWELSEELFALSKPENRERRLPRSAFGIVRR
jgi:hypothetical protein